MTPVAWDPAWSMGDPSLDRHHHELLEQMERLTQAMADGRPDVEMQRTLLLLATTVGSHFKEEEELMTRSGFPDLERHQQLHHDLRNHVKHLLATFRQEPNRAAHALLEFLVTLQIKHIAQEDWKLAGHLRQVGWDAVAPSRSRQG